MSGAAFLTHVHFPIGEFTWIQGKPTRYRSFSEAERGFCDRCGSTLTMHELSSATGSRSLWEVLTDRKTFGRMTMFGQRVNFLGYA
jgi:hypothetical protein